MASACTKIKQHIPCDLRPADRQLGCGANSKAPLGACTRSVLADSFESIPRCIARQFAVLFASACLAAWVIWACAANACTAPVSGTHWMLDWRVHHGIYFNDGNTIGSGGCDAGQDLLYLAAISPITRSQRSFPKLL